MRLRVLKDQFKKMMRDEKGVLPVSFEALIGIVGFSIVASVAIYIKLLGYLK